MSAARARDVESEADRVANALASGMTTSVDRKVLRALLLKTDGWMFCRGRMANIKSKHLGAGIYDVRLVLRTGDVG